MSTTHKFSIRTPYPISQNQLSNNGTYLAVPFTKSSIGVWSLQSWQSKPLELVAHKRRVSAIAFGFRHNPTLLCTAGSDYIIVWNIEKSRETHDTGHQIRGTIIGTNYEEPQYVSFNPDDNLLAVCVENEVLILDAQKERLDTRLEGHTALVTCAEFCPHSPDTVVSASEDRTFKVWDIATQCLIYQSSIISASPFISLTIDPYCQCVALGTTDGQVRIYDLSEGKGFRCLHHVDIAKHIRQQNRLKAEQKTSTTSQGPATISSKPSWKKQDTDHSLIDGEDDDDSVECGESILNLGFSSPKTAPKAGTKEKGDHSNVPAFLLPDTSLVEELSDSTSHLMIGTPGALIQLNAASCMVEQYVDFQGPVQSEENIDQEDVVLGVAGNYSFSSSLQPSQVTCLIGSLFHNSVHTLTIRCDVSRKPESDPVNKLSQMMGKSLDINATESDGSSAKVSVVPNVPLAEKSFLRSELVPKSSKQTAAGSTTKRSKSAGTKNTKTKDQPLTFKTKVRSSGYTEISRTKMFTPQTKQTSTKKASSSMQKSSSAPGMRSLLKEYPNDSEPPETLKTKLVLSERGSPINAISFSDDGQSLACAMADKSAQILKMPLTGKGTAFSGHNGVLNSARWSHDNQWLLTTSDDKTARVWTRGLADPVMTFDRVNNNFGSDKEKPTIGDKSNPLFEREIKLGQFYYVDRFVLLMSSSSLFMYKYHLDTKVDDIKRYQTNSRYKLVKQFQLGKAQQITAMSAINTFNSYIVLCAGSDKSIEALDMNVGMTATHIPDVQSRAVHVIAQNQGSIYASHQSSSYDLFATSAVTDGIKVWDLRSNKCVKHLEGHLNRAHHCGLCFSPCGKYIATGAEDRSAYVYDLRGGTYLRKLSGHTEVVSDVTFHPLYPEIVTATLDGKLRLYSDR
ncbi:WD repeat-containing protein 27-like [Lytechinus variegatus]|uniref:WD repeat-containing protein 27-like n=1 Tax=Lytechinus variegatus TaxID=7654 RepID=UPI001BB162CE|nr:WD repeat-containing protein 27-like [Lytechinus variegatus]XP_041468721.1 WD repeat-containing protein 27-like [Lytechinus variegatus]